MRKLKLGLFIFALVFIFPNIAAAKNIKYESIANTKMTLISYEKSNSLLHWTSTAIGQLIQHKEQAYFNIEARGDFFNKDGQKTSFWDASSYSLLEGDKLIPYNIKIITKNVDNEVLENVEKFYNYKSKKINTNINGMAKDFELRSNTIDKHLLAVALMAYPFEQKDKIKINLLTHEPALYPADIEYRGKEKIKVMGREIECYKLEMLFDVGLLNIFRVFIPKFYFWYAVDPPHYFMRYEGLEDGLNTPYVVIDVTKLEAIPDLD